MEDINLYDNLYNENYTDSRKGDLIQRVFENKAKSLLANKSQAFKFADGGGVDDDADAEKIYTPYEFLHTLLHKVYGRDYVVSDEVGKQYEEKIKQDENELEEYIQTQFQKYGVKSLYKIKDELLVEEIEIRRRKIISDKSFITESELVAYLFCHPELHTEHYVLKKPIFDVEDMIKNGLVMVDYEMSDNSYVYSYKYEYLSGNLYKKLTRLRRYKDRLIELGVMSEEQFVLQETALMQNLPKQAKISLDVDTSLFILPKSKFAEKFKVRPEDMVQERIIYGQESLVEAFRNWTQADDTFEKILLANVGGNLRTLHKYFTDFELLPSKADEREKILYAENRTKAYRDGKVLLLEFLNKGLTTNCQLRLEYEWNEIYNYYTEPKYYKIPVACQLSSKFKYGSNFTPNETQIQSIQFEKSVGSGLLAYGVGVGKTASAILNVSYSLDNGLCKKPIFIVPNPTYRKWQKEMFGGVAKDYVVQYVENGSNLELSFEDESKAVKFAKAVDGVLKESVKKIFGHIPHRNKVVDLFNLSEDYIRNIKDFTEEEEQEMLNISKLNKYLKTISKDYDFTDNIINNEILELFPQFSYQAVVNRFEEVREQEFQIWYSKPKNQDGWGRREYFNQYEFKKNMMQVFTMDLKIYREELPYTKGTMKTFEDGTIFFATYDALDHLGFKLENEAELEDDDSIFGELFNEISQGDSVSDINYTAKNSLPSLWKNAVYGKTRTKIDIRELGIDYAVFDESHYLKKVFTDCKGIPERGGRTRGNTGTVMREERKYNFGKGELPSTTALIGFLITRYIQDNNGGKNVIHLTATPFTNKPAEIYSMMALTNGKMLSESGFQYMEEFFDVFMDISYELIFGNTGVERKESLLGYRNLPQLRNLIYSMMDYKSGEDANIKRPKKILFPSVAEKRETTLPETKIQDELFKQIKDYQRGKISWSELCADSQEDLDIDEQTEEQLLQIVNDKGTDDEREKFDALEKPLSEDEFDALKKVVTNLVKKKVETIDETQIVNQQDRDSFRVIQGLGTLKAVTLSPYLSTCQKEAGIEPTYTQYIESSPKLTYTLECIKSIHDYEFENNLRKSGIVIYMSAGVNVSYKYKNAEGREITFKWSESGFQKIKQYLVQKMGYTDEEVVLVAGSMSNNDKERAKNSFLSGKSSVLIGSSTISTGVDLQDNASALFLCSYDWNPTDNEQISGRIHRQGNRFKEIRIVYPMVMNSADPNIFQQLYEKTLRIKNIWDRNDKGNTLDLKDFDVNSLRKGILDDPEDLAKYWLEEQKEVLDRRYAILGIRRDDMRNATYFDSTIKKYTPVVKGMIVILDAYQKIKNKKEIEERLKEKLQEVDDEYDDIEDLEERFSTIAKAKAKIVKETYDFKNDPDGRYQFLTYDELGDDMEVFRKLSSIYTNSDSLWRGYKSNGQPRTSSSDRNEIRYNFIPTNFPRFNDGKYNLDVPEEEDVRITNIDFAYESSPLNVINSWKGSILGMNKLKEKLADIQISLEDVPKALEEIEEQREQISNEITQLTTIYPQKILEYTALKEERRIVQPTIERRVEEFASMNYILHKEIITFKEDKAKYVEVPVDKLAIKPSRKIKQVIEEAVLVEDEVVNEIDTSDLISNLEKGLVIRFNFGGSKNRKKVMDLFLEDEEFVLYTAYENSNGDVVDEGEDEILSESEVIEFYINNYSKISEQFYDDEVEDEEEIQQVPVGLEITENEFKLLQYLNETDHSTDGNGITGYIDEEFGGLSVKELKNITKELSKKGVLEIGYMNDSSLGKLMWASVQPQYQVEDETAYVNYRLVNLVFNGEPIENYYDDNKFIVLPNEVEDEAGTEEPSFVKLKDWYIENYPDDDLGESIDDDNTFEDLWDGLNNKVNVYDIIGYGDSVLRERLFEHLSEIKNVDYDYVYNLWVGTEEDEEIAEIPTEKLEEDIYQDSIEGYELLLEIETDEEKIKLYQDAIEGYELLLELKNENSSN